MIKLKFLKYKHNLTILQVKDFVASLPGNEDRMWSSRRRKKELKICFLWWWLQSLRNDQFNSSGIVIVLLLGKAKIDYSIRHLNSSSRVKLMTILHNGFCMSLQDFMSFKDFYLAGLSARYLQSTNVRTF